MRCTPAGVIWRLESGKFAPLGFLSFVRAIVRPVLVKQTFFEKGFNHD